jgi:hypothetical protein
VALMTPLVRQATIPPEIATGYSIPVNQTINPLMTDLDTASSSHKASYLIGALFVLNLLRHPNYQ